MPLHLCQLREPHVRVQRVALHVGLERGGVGPHPPLLRDPDVDGGPWSTLGEPLKQLGKQGRVQALTWLQEKTFTMTFNHAHQKREEAI